MLFWPEMVQSRRRFPLLKKKSFLSSPKAIASSQHPGLRHATVLPSVGEGDHPFPVIHSLPESLPVSEEGLVSQLGLWLWALG